MTVKFEQLVHEFEREVIGQKIYDLVVELAKLASLRFRSPVYNGQRPWTHEDVLDLAHEVITKQLLTDGQLQRIVLTSQNIDQLRGGLFNQIKRCLSSRRNKTPLDRLVGRISSLAEEGAIGKSGEGADAVFHRMGDQPLYRGVSEQLVFRCANAVSNIPILYSRLESSRESMIYRKASLTEFLNQVFELAPALKVRDFYAILEIVLTPWVPTSLVPNDGLLQLPEGDSEIEDGDALVALAQNLVQGWSADERDLFVSKCQNIPDATIAEHLNLSRPTVAKKKAALFEGIRLAAQANPEMAPDSIVDAVLSVCSTGYGISE